MLNKIFQFFKKINFKPKWALAPFRFIWSWLLKLSLPAILIILLVIPLFVSSLRTQREEAQKNSFPLPEKLTFGTIAKTIVTTAKVEYDYIYNVRVFQDSIILDNLVEEGQIIENGQLLARLNFVNTRELTPTEIITQLNSAKQNLKNSQLSKENILQINTATQNQQLVGVKNTEESIQELDDKIVREKEQNQTKINELNTEIIKLQADYDKLKFEFDINNSVNQLEAEVDSKEAKISQLENAGGTQTQRIKADIAKLNNEITALQSSLSTGVCDVSNVNFNQTSCNKINQDIDDKQDRIDDLEQDLERSVDDDQDEIEELENEIDDLEQDIIRAKNNPGFSEDFYKFNQPISSTQAIANASNELAKLDAKINQKENEKEQRENNEIVESLEDQRGALIRAQAAEKSGNNLQDTNLKSNISQADQQIATTKTQIQNLNLLLADTQKDIEDQQARKELKAKLGGIVSKVNYKEGLEVPALQSQFEIVSQKKVLRLLIKADNRSKLKVGMPVRLIQDGVDQNLKNTLDKLDLNISQIGVSPVENLTGADPEYEVDIDLPLNTEVVVAGQNIDIEVVIEEKKDVFYLPKTAVVDNQVYIASEPKERNSRVFYNKIEARKVELGIDTGRFVEILSGVSNKDLIFPIFAQSQNDLTRLKNQFAVDGQSYQDAGRPTIPFLNI